MIELREPKKPQTLPRSAVIRQVMRAGGPGGQHQNKTESAVRLIHIATGTMAESRSDRSQHANFDIAMGLLVAKLKARGKLAAEADDRTRYQAKPSASYGSQLRSYFLDRDRRVVDHRTGCESANVRQVLAGNIDEFLVAEMRSRLA